MKYTTQVLQALSKPNARMLNGFDILELTGSRHAESIISDLRHKLGLKIGHIINKNRQTGTTYYTWYLDDANGVRIF